MTSLCYCIEEDCERQHGTLPQVPTEFYTGRCVDCGMSVPQGDIICEQCKDAWQWFNRGYVKDPASGDLRRHGDTAVQQGLQELQDQSNV